LSPNEPSDPLQEPSKTPAADPVPPSHDVTPQEALSLIVQRGLWPLDVDAARQRLQRISPVSQNQPDATELSLEGGPSGVVKHFQVTYRRYDQPKWAFDSAGFFFGGEDLRRLHQELEALLVQQLGKPEWTDDSGEEFSSAGWSIGNDLSLMFTPSPNGGERLLGISISEPQGEAE
jgi:hypothetical protein